MRAQLLLLLLGALVPTLAVAEKAPLIVTILRYNPPVDDLDSAHWSTFFEAELERALSWADAMQPRDDTYAVRKLGLLPTDRLTHAQAAEAGRLLEAAHAIYGTLTFGDGRWTIVTTIVDPASEAAESFTVDGSELWTVRDELVNEISSRLDIAITEEEREDVFRRWLTTPEALPLAAKLTYLSATNGSIEESLTLSKQVGELEPKNIELLTRHAGLLYSNGLPKEALAALEKALEMGTRGPHARLVYAQLLRSSGADAKANEEINKAFEEYPNSVSVLRHKGLHVLRQDKDPKGAIKILREAQSRAPFDSLVAASLASAQATAGNRVAAEEALARAITLAAGEPPLINEEYSIGLAARSLGDAPAALRALKRCHAQAKLEKVGERWIAIIGRSLESIEQRLKMTPVPGTRPRTYTKEQLAEELEKKLTVSERAKINYPLTINDEMRSWAQELVKDIADPAERARVLFETMSTRLGTLTRAGIRTAEEVFREWDNPSTKFSCQEYAKLFVVLGREVGLDTYLTYVERDYSGDHLYHACAALFLNDECFLVDPAYHWFGVPHKTYVILDDIQTIAGQLSQPSAQVDDESALINARSALKLYPDWNYGRSILTRCLLNLNRLSEAQFTLNKTQEIHPNCWDTPLFLSKLAYQQERYKDSERHAREFVEKHPHDSNAHAALAAALAEQKNYVQAREHFRRCLRRNPNERTRTRVLKYLATLNFHLGHGSDSALSRGLQKLTDGDYAGAETEYIQAIEEEPDSSTLYWKLAFIQIHLEKNEEAVTSLEKAVELLHGAITVKRLEETLAYLQVKEKLSVSTLLAQRGLKRFPNDPTLTLALSSCHFMEQEFDAAVRTAKQAHAHLQTERSQIWVAFLLAMTGEWNEASLLLLEDFPVVSKKIAIQEIATRRIAVYSLLGRFDDALMILRDRDKLPSPEILDGSEKNMEIYLKWEAQLHKHIAKGRPQDHPDVQDLLQSLSRRLILPAITSAQLQKYFNKYSDRFSGKNAERELTIFSVAPDKDADVEALANEVREKLIAGASVKDATGEAEKTGKIRVGERAWALRDDIAEILQESAFSTKLGTVSPIVTHKGYHMFCQVHGERGGEKPRLDHPGVSDLVKSALIEDRRKAWETRYWNELHRRIDEIQPQAAP